MTSPDRQELAKQFVVIRPTRIGEFFIRAWISDYWMDFECVKCRYWTTEQSKGWSGPNVPLYDKKESLQEECGGSPPTEDPEDGFVHMMGFLKWDGCMEISREKIHSCGAEDLEDEYQCIRRIHELAAEVMGHWESDVPRDLIAPEAP